MKRIALATLAAIILFGAMAIHTGQNQTISATENTTTYTTYILTANLNLRTGPSTDMPSLGIVPMGTVVYLLQAIDNEWYRVRTPQFTRTVEDEHLGEQVGYMAVEFLRLSPMPVNISDYGRMVAEEFLMDFYTIFRGYGWRDTNTGLFYHLDTNTFQWHITDTPTDDMPMFYLGSALEYVWDEWPFFGGIDRVYDRYGNVATNADFVRDDFVAWRFSLYDFDNNGIPVIIIDYVYGTSNGMGYWGIAIVFRYINGAYREIGNLEPFPTFFADPYGNAIAHYNNDYTGVYEYYYFVLSGSDIVMTPVLHLGGYSIEDWWEHHDNTFWARPSIFGIGTPLTRIYPAVAMENIISEAVTHRLVHGDLQADDEPDAQPDAPIPGQYIHTPVSTHETFIPNPATLAQVNSPATAVSQIQNTIDSLTPLQRTSGDAINTVTLHIENIVRRGSTQNMPANGNLSAAILSGSADIAADAYRYANMILHEENIQLMRYLRTNLNFETDEIDMLSITFPDGTSAVPFDNVTIESEFAAVTLNRQNILPGSQIDIRLVETGGENNFPATAATSPNEEETNNSDHGASEVNIFTRLWDEMRDFSTPITILLNYWFVIAIFILLIIWFIVAGMGERLRKWVVPTFAILALAANISLVMLRINNNTTTYTPGDYTAEHPEEAPTLTPATYYPGTVEVTMNPGMRATLSLPVNGNDPEFLVLVNQAGEIQHSRYNPATGNIDARIRESGTYSLLEIQVNFADIDDKSQLMQNAILQLASRGIMQGARPGYFHPDAPISRTELTATIIMAFDMLDTMAQSSFTDINRQAWYYQAVATAQQEGLVAGYPDGTFRGEDNIPKEQLVVMAARSLIEQMGYHVPEDIHFYLERFVDRDVLRSWSLDGIALATSSNVLIHRADGMFAPQSAMTRGDAAIILYRVFNRVW